MRIYFFFPIISMERMNDTPLPETLRALDGGEQREAAQESSPSVVDATTEQVRLRYEAFLAQREALAASGRR